MDLYDSHYPPKKVRAAENEYFIGSYTVGMAWSKKKCSMTFIFTKCILSNHKSDPTIHLFTWLSAVMIVNNYCLSHRWFSSWEKFFSGSINFLLYKGILWIPWMGCFISTLLLDFSLSDKDWILLMGWFRFSYRIITFRDSLFQKKKMIS